MADYRDNVTQGRGAIVLRVSNGYGFAEHMSLQAAKAEARRLCERLGGKFIVYAPVATIEPAPKTVETDVRLASDVLRDDELPW